MKRAFILLAVVALSLVAAVAARAETIVRQDDQGRPITFDVLAPEVDVDWYAALLRAAAHGNEIANVTIRIVAPSEIRSRCGSGAVACYSSRGRTGLITVPAGDGDALAATVLHEYGHHVDSAWHVAGVEELNGTPVWWEARGMAALLTAGRVAFDYSLGWSHSVGEIFAEDYAFLHTGAHYSIPWLAPPDDALRAALLEELKATVPPPVVSPPSTPTRPLTITRSGTLAPAARRTLPFGLLGPNRRVTVTATVAAPRGARAGARIQVVCGGALVRSIRVTGTRPVTLDARGLGPASCEAALVSTSAARQRYTLRLRLAVEL